MTATDLGLDLLTGPEAGDLLAAVVGEAGGELLSWRPAHVDHRPGTGTTVSYDTRVAWPDGERDETLGASAGMPPPARPGPGLVSVSDGERDVAVWRVPHDPDLPALAAAHDPDALAGLLREHGVDPAGLRVSTVSYRPRRRAVLRLDAAGGRFYLKVLKPGGAEPLHRRHALLAAAGLPVPVSLGWTGDGLLVLAGLPGAPMRRVLRGGGPLPAAAEVTELVARLPESVLELPRHRPWAELAGHYAAVIGGGLPAEAARAEQLAAAVAAAIAGADDAPEPTHGDLYEAQLMLDGGRISGLLDVDTAGPGRRADDLACALAHLDALAVADPDSAPGCAALAADWWPAFSLLADPAELRARAAGVVVSLATGPMRHGREGWQAATSELLDRAETLLT